MKIWLILGILIFGNVGTTTDVLAQSSALQLEANNALEWDRDKRIFSASGEVEIKKDDIVLRAEKVVAKYKESEDGDVLIQKITAIGRPYVMQDDDRIDAKILIAYLNDAGDLTQIEAREDVFITTPMEEARSDKGVYDVQTQNVILSGDVTLSRGANIIEGDKAEFDLKTNVAKVFSDNNGDDKGRVRGIFYVEDKDKNN